MSDARNDQTVIDAIASTECFEALARSCGMSKEDFLREWNKGAAYADRHWADQPHERSAGREYKQHKRVSDQGHVYIEQEWIK